MRDSLAQLYNSKALNALRSFFSSYAFPFVTAAIILTCYYLAWDMVTIYYIAICGITILFLFEDITPIFAVFTFMTVMVSKQHSPSPLAYSSDYYTTTPILIQVGILIGLFALAAVIKIIFSIKDKKFKVTPTFFGLCAFAAAMLLNGVMSENYEPMDTLYGFFLAFLFLALFVLGYGNIKFTKANITYICWCFVALSLTMMIELAVLYMTTDGIIEEGVVIRQYINFGWGMYNNMGVLYAMCIPFIFYLAYKYKHGYVFTIYATLVLIAALFTMSRQSMIGSILTYALGALVLVITTKHKVVNLSLFAIMAACVAIFAIVKWDLVSKLFVRSIMQNLTNGSGRLDLWAEGLVAFSENPVFGKGFYVDLYGDPGFAGMDIIPLMYHNTVIQLLGACGTLGLLTYAIHRTQTVISLIKNITVERLFITISILGLLICNLFDNHLFYILPTILYSMLLSVLIKGEKVTHIE